MGCISAMIFVWILRVKIIRTVLCCAVLCLTVVYSDRHTHVSTVPAVDCSFSFTFHSGVIVCCIFGPIPCGTLCHALSLSLLLLMMSWTSHAACTIAIAGVQLATPGDWQCNGGSQ